MVKKNKRIEAVSIKVDSNMDAHDYGQRIVECVQQLNPDLDVVILVKVDFGDLSIPKDTLAVFLKNLRDMFNSVNARNCLFVPLGKSIGVRNVMIDHLKVIDDDSN